MKEKLLKRLDELQQELEINEANEDIGAELQMFNRLQINSKIELIREILGWC